MHNGAYFSLLSSIECPPRDIFPLVINVGLRFWFSVKIKISLDLVYGVNAVSKGILQCVCTCICVGHHSLVLSAGLEISV